MTQNNQKIFRVILKVLGVICIFLLGSVINIPVSAELFAVIVASTLGLTVGYFLGTGKDLRFWKKFAFVKKDDEQKK